MSDTIPVPRVELERIGEALRRTHGVMRWACTNPDAKSSRDPLHPHAQAPDRLARDAFAVLNRLLGTETE
jgi:hypothetical protein